MTQGRKAFVKKYINAINAKHPEIHLIAGTHEPHQTDEQFRCDIKTMLKKRRKSIIP